MPVDPVLAPNDVIEFTIKAFSKSQHQQIINRNYWQILTTATPAIDELSDFSRTCGQSGRVQYVPSFPMTTRLRSTLQNVS